MHACMWRPEVNFQCCSMAALLVHRDKVSYWPGSCLPSRLGWLDRGLQGPAPPLQFWGFKHLTPHLAFFFLLNVGSGDWFHVLLLVKITKWAVPPAQLTSYVVPSLSPPTEMRALRTEEFCHFWFPFLTPELEPSFTPSMHRVSWLFLWIK